jgi:hypothetical protein
MTKLSLLIVFFLYFFSYSFGQEIKPKNEIYTKNNKGKVFIYWGGNRGDFSKSDISFRGNGYNFSLKNVVAHDKPKGYHIDYINPTRMTIPQTNFRIGYFVSNHYSVSLGLDHMKYVLTQNQTSNISGFINLPETENGSVFNGEYVDDNITLTKDFIIFEHTDGLNYINTEIARVDDISNLFNIHNTDIFQINLTEGVSGGLLLPKTNSTLLSKERNDNFHISGYGLSAKAGLNLTFCKHFFIQGDIKGGYINMNDIRTTRFTEDRASQSFFFLERIIVLGGIFRI